MRNSEAKEPGTRAVWGLGSTIAWGVVIAIVYFSAQTVGIVAYIAITHPDYVPGDSEGLYRDYLSDGMALSWGMIGSTIVCLAMVLVAIKLKKRSSIASYLGLRAVGFRRFGYWLIALILLEIAFELLHSLLSQPLNPEFVRYLSDAASHTWLLWLAIVLAAPLSEEVLFRGFLFTGLKASIVGPAGAIAMTSLFWATLHLQYDFLGMIHVFTVGILLGLARHKTGSILLTFNLHALLNLGAMIFTGTAAGT